MAGYREYAPGQVWFYYNPKATKENEKRNELGAVSSRPVVILQAAFYPEWSDVITVCPLTSSDRRTGVYIDSTILKDGSLIEGGTVMPYLMYTIRAKYLFPIIAHNLKRRLISLAPEDWAQVQQGYFYHLGVPGVEPPDYVKEWKHLSEFDRNIVIHDVKLAINDMEDMVKDGTLPSSSHTDKKGIGPNPPLVQTPPPTSHIENHLLASMDNYDRSNRSLYSSEDCFNSAPIGAEEPAPTSAKPVQTDHHIGFKATAPFKVANILAEETGEFFPIEYDAHIYPGSEYLGDVEMKVMPEQLNQNEHFQIMTMTVSQIVANTGIHSTSTASRLRMALRKIYTDNGLIEMDGNDVIFKQAQYEPFIYRGDLPINKKNAKRNLRRFKYLFSVDRQTVLEHLEKPLSEFAAALHAPLSYAKQMKIDFINAFPNLTYVKDGEEHPISEMLETVTKESISAERGLTEDRFPLWLTLSPMEIHEVRSCTKRNMQGMAKNFGISKERAKVLQTQLLGKPKYNLPEITTEDQARACTKVITDDFNDIEPLDLLIFCRCDYYYISNIYATQKSSNTPNKSQVRQMKNRIRRLIVFDMRISNVK